jgi:hypothetical protein
MNIDSTMKELAEYIRMSEEIAAKYTRTTESRRFTFS